MKPRERLEFLANALEADAADENGMKFDLTLWLRSLSSKPARDCGTVGCAVGLAMLLPEFQAEGLETRYGGPFFNGFVDFAAVAEFFAISPDHAKCLFNGVYYKGLPIVGAAGELTVASRIRKYLITPNAAILEAHERSGAQYRGVYYDTN